MSFGLNGARVEMSQIGGTFLAVPSGTTNGSLIPIAGMRNGVRLYPNGGTITYTIASLANAPSSAPTITSVVSGAAGTFVDENLGPDAAIYVTATSGSPFYRLM